MNLNDHTRKVREQLLAAAALGDDRTQQIAGTLAATVDSSVRLAILDAVSAAAAEITTALFDASSGHQSPAVSVQLDGDEVRVLVSHAPSEPADAPRPDDGEANARISLRLSDSLKADIEKAATAADVSVNAWLVRAAANALRSGGGQPGGWPGSSWLPAGEWPWGHHGRGGTRITGWVTG
jgi:hypothetical protein